MSSVSDDGDAIVRLAPSDLTFLWAECPRCFWFKAKGHLKRPSAPMPKVFTRLDQQTKDYFFGKRAEGIAEGLYPGRVAVGDRWVRSRPLIVPGHRTLVTFAGRIDTALGFDDGSFGIIDFKTSEPRDEHVPFYSRQLHSYALAVEYPAPGAFALTPVRQLGLVCIEPQAMVGLEADVAYRAQTVFLEIPRDDDAFFAFISQVLFVLERPDPPDASPGCSYCAYLAAGSLLLLTGMHRR
jgi:hypothetical protein